MPAKKLIQLLLFLLLLFSTTLFLFFIPQATDDSLKNRSAMMPAPQMVNFVLYNVKEQELWMIRELVGSIHMHFPKALRFKIHVLHDGELYPSFLEEISSWDRVQVIHLYEHFLLPKNGHDSEYLIQLYIRNQFAETQKVFLLKAGYNFRSAGGIERLVNADVNSLKLFFDNKDLSLLAVGQEDFNSFYERSLNCLKGNCKEEMFNFRSLPLEFLTIEVTKKAEEYGLIPVVQALKEGQPIGYHKLYCNIMPKEDIIYSNYGQVFDQRLLFEKKAVVVGLLTLTHNIAGIKESALFRMLLPSLARTVSSDEVNEIKIVMYLGYDAEDPVFDSNKMQEARDLVQQLVGDKIIVKYHRLPRFKRLTLLWNVLAFSAFRDGCDYLFQVNDDSVILNSGWLGRFVHTLKKSDNLGVVGPNDALWDCKLITQAFASRKHMVIFGWFFPPQIRDWYSDNWITYVYGKEHTFCAVNHKIQNGIKKDHSKRYMECDSPKWREAIDDGKARIQKYLQGV